MNNDWKTGYKEGFADGYMAAKKEMNYQNLSYQNFPPVYYKAPETAADPRTVAGPIKTTGTVEGLAGLSFPVPNAK
jgi:hypothetical protein